MKLLNLRVSFMKRIGMIYALLLLVCALGFSEGDSAIDDSAESSAKDSVLSLKFLVDEHGFLKFTKYQNFAVSYKGRDALLDSVPKNARAIKKHRSSPASSLAFAGMLAACVATDAVYTCGDDLPHKETIFNTASAMGLCPGFAKILAGETSTAHYLIATDAPSSQ